MKIAYLFDSDFLSEGLVPRVDPKALSLNNDLILRAWCSHRQSLFRVSTESLNLHKGVKSPNSVEPCSTTSKGVHQKGEWDFLAKAPTLHLDQGGENLLLEMQAENLDPLYSMVFTGSSEVMMVALRAGVRLIFSRAAPNGSLPAVQGAPEIFVASSFFPLAVRHQIGNAFKLNPSQLPSILPPRSPIAPSAPLDFI